MSTASNPKHVSHNYRSRRDFITRSGCGIGMLALQDLLRANQPSTESARHRHRPHFPAKAKSVIWLFMHGAPSQIDTWDYKPELRKRDGQTYDGFDQSTGFFAGLGGPIMNMGVRDLSSIKSTCRQTGDDPFLLRQGKQSCSRPDRDEHRNGTSRISFCRIMDYVWVRNRKSKLTRFHCHV